MARVQVRLLNFDRATNQDAPLWALTPSAPIKAVLPSADSETDSP